MLCPSDFRFGDQFDPRSPHYEGEDLHSIVVPYTFEDEDGIVRRAELSVEYDYESSDDGREVSAPEIIGIEVSGISITKKQAFNIIGDLPEGKELVDLVEKAETWQRTAYIDFPAKTIDGKDVGAKLILSYTAFPPAPDADSAVKFEVRDVCPQREVRVSGVGDMKLHDFMRSYPGNELPGIDDVKQAIYAFHAEKYPDMFEKKSVTGISQRM